MDHLDIKEFVVGYLAEVEEHLRSANANLLALDESLRKREHNPRAVRELFRRLHTVKGLSAMVGAEPIVDISHEMETLLRSADRAGGRIHDSAVDLLLSGVRAIEERVKSLSRGETLEPAPKQLLDRLGSLQVGQEPGTPSGSLSLDAQLLAKLSLAEQEQLLLGLSKGQTALRVDFVPSAARAAAGLNITAIRQRVAALGELVKVLPRALSEPGGGGGVAFVLLLLTDAPLEAVATAAAAETGDVQRITVAGGSALPLDEAPESGELEPYKRNVVRVDVARLDEALERLAVLVVSRSRLARAVSTPEPGLREWQQVGRLVAEGARELRDLRAAIMRARMVSVAELLERAPLIVLGLCRASGKQVRLTIDAGQAELDKAVADRLFPAVVHLLRNAVDHAIEPPAERRALGKDEDGHVHVTCLDQAGSQLELVVADDGRGIDRQRVASRVNAAVPETDAELLDLIARPGLSTLDAATHTSGRGLGIDIVRQIAVGELGGELRMSTTAGRGTTFTLRVPVSITIMDAFALECGGQTFVIPVSAVDALTELSPEVVTETPEASRRASRVRLLRHRGATIPLFALSSLLGIAAKSGGRSKAVIVRRQADVFAFEVDRMLGKQEVVVRPVKDPLVEVDGISGSTDLGDGRPTLVLDLLGLLARERQGSAVAS
jgi:two-component system chemotaxis sensor kinase CheA